MQNGLNTLILYSNDVLVFHIFSITYYALTGLFKQGGRKQYKSNNNLCSFVKKKEAKKSWEAARLQAVA